jgi:hypothetical protein
MQTPTGPEVEKMFRWLRRVADQLQWQSTPHWERLRIVSPWPGNVKYYLAKIVTPRSILAQQDTSDEIARKVASRRGTTRRRQEDRRP